MELTSYLNPSFLCPKLHLKKNSALSLDNIQMGDPHSMSYSASDWLGPCVRYQEEKTETVKGILLPQRSLLA